MPGILLGTLCVMISNLQMRKPRLREVKFFSQGHTACKIYSKPYVCPTLVCFFITNYWTFLSGCWVKYLCICLYKLLLPAQSWKPSCILENLCHEAPERSQLWTWLSFCSTESPWEHESKHYYLGIYLRKLNEDLRGDN